MLVTQVRCCACDSTGVGSVSPVLCVDCCEWYIESVCVCVCVGHVLWLWVAVLHEKALQEL